MSTSSPSSSSPSHSDSQHPPAFESDAQIQGLFLIYFSFSRLHFIFSSPCDSYLSFSSLPQLTFKFISLSLCSFYFAPFLSEAEVVAKRCGHSKPPNNRPFMMPCNAMMILLCPPPPTLHQPPQLHRNVVQQVTRSPSSLPPATIATTTSPVMPPSQPKPLFSQIKKTEKARNYRGGETLQTEHKERIHARSHTLLEKKEGDPFKCGAAALIYWVKMGKKEVTKGQIVESFFIHPHGWRVTASSTLTKSA